MTSRADVVHWALAQNGRFDGVGYPGHNTYSPDLGRPQEYWCGDFVTDAFKRAGDPLVSMQPGCRTGYAYCPDAVNWGRAHHAVVNSWDAQPGDIALFDWNGNGEADHTEIVERWANGVLWTVGGDSGPSNVDHFRGQGGVHRHTWSAPHGVGNRQIIAILSAPKCTIHSLSGASTPPRTAPPVPAGARQLMLKSPMMHGADVGVVQTALNHHGAHLRVDDIFGPACRDATIAFQRGAHLGPDGIVGPQTRHALGLPA